MKEDINRSVLSTSTLTTTMLISEDLTQKNLDGPDEKECCAFKHEQFFIDQENEKKGAMKKLILITSCAMIFSAIEITGGLLSGSVAILADATDGLCDILGYWI